MARGIHRRYLVGAGSLFSQELVASISAQLDKEEPPPRDLFTPLLVRVRV